ncbi:hypothetical protein SCE1572_32090 [Sorangium cellulosum So0157-2]|uniref:Uncharacterized protein n=1 Tax=Sorangium cellulosum So0157-2 TaxID=1254432 RepID=S4Y3C8_SORCE|nr:hypothetical protein SCE1572_32090 [Sorangium cellulosum So0157-2]
MPWVMIVDSSATTGRPAASAFLTSDEMERWSLIDTLKSSGCEGLAIGEASGDAALYPFGRTASAV